MMYTVIAKITLEKIKQRRMTFSRLLLLGRESRMQSELSFTEAEDRRGFREWSGCGNHRPSVFGMWPYPKDPGGTFSIWLLPSHRNWEIGTLSSFNDNISKGWLLGP